MKAKNVTKILIFDQGDPVAGQMLGKAKRLFEANGSGEPDRYHQPDAPEIVMLRAHRTHNLALDMMERTIRAERPELVLIGATALGEEIAPALGVRLETGVAAHCVDIKVNEEGRLTFVIPAFGGSALGEIFIPGAEAGRPAIATVKPGIFADTDRMEDGADAACRVIDVDTMAEDGRIDSGSKTQGGYRLTGTQPRERASADISKADLIVCGGYGLGSEAVWRKLETLANRLGGAVACTRAALDADWGCAETSMIGTSGRAVRPKVYLGLGVSGAAHHTCGITSAGVIININTDRDADAFAVSDYKGVFDAEQVIDALLDQIE